MARGFESKDVEFQQAEAERVKTLKRPLTLEEQKRAVQRLTVELSLSRARADLLTAKSPAHRHMLEQAITALEAQLANHE